MTKNKINNKGTLMTNLEKIMERSIRVTIRGKT